MSHAHGSPGYWARPVLHRSGAAPRAMQAFPVMAVTNPRQTSDRGDQAGIFATTGAPLPRYARRARYPCVPPASPCVILLTQERAHSLHIAFRNHKWRRPLRSNIVRWIIAMTVAVGMTAVAIIAIDRAVDYYLDGLRAQNTGRTHNANSSPAQSWHPAAR
jgi:hypothetical protein